MSQNNNAEETSSDLAPGVANLKIAEEEKLDAAMEIKVKSWLDEKADSGSEVVEEGAEIEDDDDKEDEEPEAYIQFLFDPEVPETILNEYVINEIAKYADFQDLKSLRRLNKLWSMGATPAFVAKAAISLIYGQKSEGRLMAFGAETEKLKGINPLKINLLFSGFGKEVEMFNDIFSALAPALKPLELQNMHGVYSGFFLRGGNPISLPALTTFTLGYEYLDIEKERRRIFQYLYTAAPALRHLVVEPFRPPAFSPLLSDDGCRNWALAPNLKSIEVNNPFHQNNSSEFWLHLINFPQSWEALDIIIVAFNRADVESLDRLLDKNKDSLVKLKLEICELPPFSVPYTLRLPATFSKLQKLELEFSGLEVLESVTFGGRELVYSEALPALVSLHVKLPIRMERAIGALFPPQVFQGLQHFKLENMNFCNLFPFPPNVELVQNWAAGIFPQATIQISFT